MLTCHPHPRLCPTAPSPALAPGPGTLCPAIFQSSPWSLGLVLSPWSQFPGNAHFSRVPPLNRTKLRAPFSFLPL